MKQWSDSRVGAFAGIGAGLMLAIPHGLGAWLPLTGALPLAAMWLIAVACARRGWRCWGATGFCTGLVFGAPQLIAYRASSLTVALAAPVLPGAQIGVGLALGAWVATRGGVGSRAARYFPALGWLCANLVSGLAGVQALALSSGVLALGSWLAAPALLLGPEGLDPALLVAATALCTRSLRVTGTALALWLLGVWARPQEGAGEPGRFHVAQPATPTEEFRATGWSLVVRDAIDDRLLAMTRDAAHREDGLIVWPETASGRKDLQVPDRVVALSRLIGETDREILVATHVAGERGVYNGAALASAGRVRGLTLKSKVVPLAESGLSAGEASVLSTRAGPIGVLICYDAVFPAVARKLVRGGAEVIVVPTDDASFGHSTTTYAHTHMARLLALSMGVPLVLASNAGPSLLADARGRVVASAPFGAREVISGVVSHRSQVRRAGIQTIGGYVLLVAGLASLIAVAVRRRGSRAATAGSSEYARASVPSWRRVGAAIAVSLVGLCGGVTGEFGLMWLRDGTSPRAAWAASRLRRDGPGVMDGIAPAFRQRSRESCGAAALAFALVQLGARVTENTVSRSCRLHGQASAADLQRCARQLHFRAEGLEADWAWLQSRSPRITVLHTVDGHFVVSTSVTDKAAAIFDPAEGRTLLVPRKEVEARWSRFALSLDHVGPWQLRSDIPSRHDAVLGHSGAR